MTDKEPNKNKNAPKQLDEDDQAVWDDFASKFDPPEEDEENFESLLDGHEQDNYDDKVDHADVIAVDEKDISNPQTSRVAFQEPQIDKRTAERLRKGKLKIEARLDLHGLNKVQAYEALMRFIISSYNQGLRHVIVITGKGKSKSTSDDWLSQGRGILKQNVPVWLNEERVKFYILKVEQAQPKDGGSGALYVYFKKNKNL